MYEPINKKISVEGIYENAKFTPKKVILGSREMPIERITLTCEVRDGGVKQRLYSVIAQGNTYRILFNRETEIWVLKEVWIDG